MSVGEVVLFNGLQRMVVEPDFLKSTPRLQAFHDRMESVGPIKEMLTSGGSMPRAFGPLWFKRRGVEKLGRLPVAPVLPPVRSSGPMQLCYFDIMARGLLPALCLQISGMEWEGERPSFEAWPAMKNSKAFWQLPVLDVPGVGQIAHQTAIANFVARKSPRELEGPTHTDYVTSQQLLQEVEDMFPKAVQRLANSVFGEPKCSSAETEQLWSEVLPVHMRNLEAMMRLRGVSKDRFTAGGMTVGELALFGFFHQLLHVNSDFLRLYPGLQSCYRRVLRDSRVAKLLDSGAAFPSSLQPFFVRRQQKVEQSPLDFLYVLDAPGVGQIAHQTAIVNFVARKSPKELEGLTEADYITSQQLLQETEDMIPKAVRRLANVVFGEPKCTGEETEQFWAEELPVHLRNLEATMKRRNVGGDRFTSGGMTVGELAIFGFFHQLLHVRADTLNGFPGLRSLYDRVLRDSRVAKLLDGGAGFSSELRLFFVPRQQKEAETPLDFLYSP
eukprot:TRINITY_DN1104_c0_g1_i9.p1 TRINITY_DN1104_c0_g1~~TRINITY_DN1104_c0_g1_i9.p1  ORF type:complete len:506 (+),score=141.13 TRINITY_DN1104_c0_g1_i9:23-1519(+)